MRLYNTLTRNKDEFVSREPGVVRMYTCGPTVYHFAHIGNLRTYIMEDVLEKYLRYSGYDVKRTMNITDVGHLSSDADEGEDKMLKGARREHKTVMEIAKYYEEAFFNDCKALNIRRPDIVVPATSRIPDYIEMIERLIEKDYAYESGGNIYFDTSKPDEYYVFNKHDIEDLEVGVRDGVERDDNKRNKSDFVLWFTKSKFDDQELKWDSPWGVGYPGWHIECSAISVKTLGEYLDIHCGGIDNAFPHHTNEIAQTEAYLGHKWCTSWFHVLHLNDESGKMSKSKGEFLTVSLLKEKGYDPMAYRLFCLGSHYRKALVFTWDGLDNAAQTYEKLILRITALVKDGASIEMGISESDAEKANALRASFAEAMDNDLNTSLAVTALYDVLKSDCSAQTKLTIIGEFDNVLSIDLIAAAQRKLEQSSAPAEGDADILARIEARAEAKRTKNYAEADRIRAELLAEGIVLTDTKDGTTYTRV